MVGPSGLTDRSEGLLILAGAGMPCEELPLTLVLIFVLGVDVGTAGAETITVEVDVGANEFDGAETGHISLLKI